MFEGTVPSISSHAAAEVGALRPVAWPELAAKFAAARDLRGVFAAGVRRSFASFAPGTAHALAARADLIPDVNPDALADGKDRGSRPVVTAEYARDGDREMQ